AGSHEQDQLQTLRSFELLGRTANTVVDGDLVSNEDWSGGALFAPPSAESFQISVTALEDPRTHPIFLGIAPRDSDLTMVNFFSTGGGIFLCLGGQASESLMSALGAPGGPAMHAFGERRALQDMPVAEAGSTVELHYTEAKGESGEVEGHLCFLLSDSAGVLHQIRPVLGRPLRRGGWCPCLLLCLPGTRVQVKRLA
ncbi:unnamed protein product, partial [Polarella glacialis]